jgi:hypothetical protein
MNAGPGQAPPPHAAAIANGIVNGSLRFNPDGSVFDPKDAKKTPKAYLSPGMTKYLTDLVGTGGKTASPTGSAIGAGANTAMSSAGSQNPTPGGSLSSALPVGNAPSSQAMH